MLNERSEILVEVTRGDLVECVHRGSVAVVDSSGGLLAYAGDPELVTFMRSASKPLQAMLLIESGAADDFGLAESELAVACGSHSGQREHVEAVSALLEKAGVSPGLLDCGVHPPIDKDSRKALYESGERPWEIHCNCSGKHAGMLAVCAKLGIDPADYRRVGHPVQDLLLEIVADMSGIAAEEIRLAPDGCGVVVHGIPVMNMAYAFASLATGVGLPSGRAEAASRIRSAMRSNPLLVAGNQRLCTAILGLDSSRFVAKSGAAGVYCIGDSQLGLGIAVKTEDGDGRAAGMTAVETMRQLELLSAEDAGHLERFRVVANTNLPGDSVGEVRPVFALRSGRIQASQKGVAT